MNETNLATQAAQVVADAENNADLKQESKAELFETLNKIEKNTRSQRTFAIIRTALIAVLAGCAVAIVFMVQSSLYTVLPGINGAIADVDDVVKTMSQVDVVKIADEISELAVTGTESVNTALSDLQVALNAVKSSLGKLEEIDVDELNGAIKNLSDTVAPLAGFFGAFGN